MTLFHHEEEYSDFMSSLVKVAAHGGTPNIPATHLAKVVEHANIAALHDVTEQAKMHELLMSLLPYALHCSHAHVSSQCAGLEAGVKAASMVDPRAQNYFFKDTSNWPESSLQDLKTDLAMYPDTEEARRGYSREMKPGGNRHTARVAWAWITMPVEAKNHPDVSAFYFEDGEGLLRDTPKGREAQAQIMKYVSQIMVRQHRIFVYLLYICRTKARITRWDRAGCVVSKPFDFTEEPEKLLDFVFRLALMSRSELGYDTTATLATSSEVEGLRTINHPNRCARECAEEILDPQTQIIYPIYKVTCKDMNGTGEGEYFIGKHSTATHSVTGRATKGYIAFIRRTSRLGFLKDYWRTDSPKVPQELTIYKELDKAGVRHVATAIGGGDVGGGTQRTVTGQYLNKSDSVALVHCRIALEELARALETYQHSGELIIITYHALLGHKDAWEKVGILHRDISVNNIMYVVDQTKDIPNQPYGILIDWDLCKRRSELKKPRTQSNRSGTWAFMSAASLQYPLKPSNLDDDLESFIYVVTFCSLRFHFHTMTAAEISSSTPSSDTDLRRVNFKNEPLGDHVQAHYYKHINDPRTGFVVGGKDKMASARNGELDCEFEPGLVSQALENLVKRLYVLLQKHYQQLDFSVLRREYSGLPKDPRSLVSLPPSSGPGPLAPATHKKHDGEDLNSHTHIVALFKTAVEELAGWADPTEKTKDQFLGLVEWVGLPPIGASGSRQSSGLGKRSSRGIEGSRASKKVRREDASLHTVHEGTDDVDEHGAVET